jgi:undecaprenyl-diphosphatase
VLATLRTNAAAFRRRFARRFPVRANPRRSRLLLLAAACAGAGIALAVPFLDVRAAGWAATLTPASRQAFGVVTFFGATAWWLAASGLALLVLLAADWSRVDRATARAWAELGAFAAFLFLAVAGAGLVADLLKLIVGRARPALLEQSGHLALQPFGFVYLYRSFPSGHATNVAAAATAVAMTLPRAGIAAAMVAGIIILSRIALGAHFPSDVIGGAFVGVTFTVLMAVAWSRFRVAFTSDGNGRLRPLTGAIRRLRRRGGLAAFGAGLRRALVA